MSDRNANQVLLSASSNVLAQLFADAALIAGQCERTTLFSSDVRTVVELRRRWGEHFLQERETMLSTIRQSRKRPPTTASSTAKGKPKAKPKAKEKTEARQSAASRKTRASPKAKAATTPTRKQTQKTGQQGWQRLRRQRQSTCWYILFSMLMTSRLHCNCDPYILERRFNA